MTSYRFPPAKMTGPFFAVLGATLLVLGMPAVLSVVLPMQEPDTEAVVLDDPEWRQPVEGLSCSRNYESMANQAWDCGDTLAEAYVTDGVDDDELALRRVVRATAYSSLPTEPIEHEGNLLVLRVEDSLGPVTAFSVAKDNLNYQIVLSGGDTEAVAQHFMEAFE